MYMGKHTLPLVEDAKIPAFDLMADLLLILGTM